MGGSLQINIKWVDTLLLFTHWLYQEIKPQTLPCEERLGSQWIPRTVVKKFLPLASERPPGHNI